MTVGASGPNPPSDDVVSELNEKTLIPLGMVAALLGLLVGGIIAATLWASDVTHRLDGIESQLIDGMDDRWRGRDMRTWVNAFDDAVEVWSLQMEHSQPGDPLPRFQVPSVDAIKGRGR